MQRIAMDIWPQRKGSPLTSVAFILVFVCLFANCQRQLFKHINGTLQYDFCSGDTCPKPLPSYKLGPLIGEFQSRLKQGLDNNFIDTTYTKGGISAELFSVKVHCSKTDGIFNCTIPPYGCTYAIYAHLHASAECTGSSYTRENGDGKHSLHTSAATSGDSPTMIMQLKGTHEDRRLVSGFSLQCPARCFIDNIEITALVYRCN